MIVWNNLDWLIKTGQSFVGSNESGVTLLAWRTSDVIITACKFGKHEGEWERGLVSNEVSRNKVVENC